jgi:hypothetical protein
VTAAPFGVMVQIATSMPSRDVPERMPAIFMCGRSR